MILFLSMVEDDVTREKLTKIYNLYRGTMIHTARGILGDSDAEDAVSEAFIRIMRNIGKIHEIDCHETRAFIVIIVRSISLDILRKKNRLAEVSIDEQFDIGATDLTFSDISAKEARDLIAECINTLNTNYSDILYLAAQGYSRTEMGDILGISEDNVRQRLSRARKALRIKLAERGYEHEQS